MFEKVVGFVATNKVIIVKVVSVIITSTIGVAVAGLIMQEHANAVETPEVADTDQPSEA